ncbi:MULTISPECIES: energy-coupling factor ABC transporter permease [Salinivibrio]|jgi:Predicted membrane protein|uniref:energy-coupling factor ABC transporter permease n=2 Tax=Vibrionaceae TaxID=641 RepID=UPI000A6CB621|nr:MULTISPECIES: energy-coupling factor ABC transporter permease [Salinivibrio]WBA18649.1 energy-coupling factor ABC transporter permease [Salinivibrio kushneri]
MFEFAEMSGWQWGGWLLWAAVLYRTYPPEFFAKLRQETGYQHLAFSSAVVLFALWALQAGIKEGLDIHFLGVTTLALCHGWRIAIWIATVPLALMAVFGFVPVADVGMTALTTAVLPITFSYGIFALSYHYLTRHLFIYIFIAAFIGAALTIVFQLSVTSLWYWLADRHSWQDIVHNYLQIALLMWFPEALLNGMAVTVMAVYRPHWLRTFYDREYLSPER